MFTLVPCGFLPLFLGTGTVSNAKPVLFICSNCSSCARCISASSFSAAEKPGTTRNLRAGGVWGVKIETETRLVSCWLPFKLKGDALKTPSTKCLGRKSLVLLDGQSKGVETQTWTQLDRSWNIAQLHWQTGLAWVGSSVQQVRCQAVVYHTSF